MRQVFSFLLCAIALCGCGPDAKGDTSDIMEDGVIARVNNITITHDKFNDLVQFESRVNPEFCLTTETKKEFLDHLIQKELLLHEASRLEIESDEKFVKKIERYWESTLIRTLIDRKTDEFKKEVLVTDEEVEKFYKDNQKTFAEPLPQIKEEIRAFMEKEKISMMFEEWIEQLKESATIIKNKGLISNFKSSDK